jgi:RimJ/RimL family protein N-acetyltransferase
MVRVLSEPIPVAVPALSTERLRLRGHRKNDLDACVALWSDLDMVRYIGGKPSTRDATWSRLLQYLGHWSVNGFGYWLVEEIATGRYVGEVGIADFLREMEPSLKGSPEAGWVIAPWAQGRGYASEALTAVLGWADANLDHPAIACLIDPDNAPSLRVADKLGFRETMRTTFHGMPTVLMWRPSR